MKTTTKKYVVSSLVTFIAAFAIAIYPMLNNLTLDNMTDGVIVAVIFAGVRAGIKALIEFMFIK